MSLSHLIKPGDHLGHGEVNPRPKQPAVGDLIVHSVCTLRMSCLECTLEPLQLSGMHGRVRVQVNRGLAKVFPFAAGSYLGTKAQDSTFMNEKIQQNCVNADPVLCLNPSCGSTHSQREG